MKDISGFRKANISDEEVHARLRDNASGKTFSGVKVIDDVFGGFKRSDLVLIGAKTGFGKTALMSEIAMNVSAQGKQVYMFALEAEDREIELRILFKKVCQETGRRLVYKKWYDNHYKDLNYQESIKKAHFENFHLYYREKDFGILDFQRSVMAIKEKADLIIVDHIHYFDLDGKNENRELGDAIKKINDITKLTKVPVLLVAHLRKETGYSKEQKLIPEIDDFHGSSDLSKICTKAIIIGQAKAKGAIVPTLFHFPKFRQFGAARNYLFVNNFDLSTETYSKEYKSYLFKYNSVSLLEDMEEASPNDMGWLG